MRISTKGRYGLKAAVELARGAASGAPVSLKTISGKQGIPLNYLEQLIILFKKADYVTSIRGPRGGYSLIKPPEEITVGEVLRLFEGSISPVECVETGEAVCNFGECSNCSTKNLWSRMYEGVTGVVDSMTLLDLIESKED